MRHEMRPEEMTMQQPSGECGGRTHNAKPGGEARPEGVTQPERRRRRGFHFRLVGVRRGGASEPGSSGAGEGEDGARPKMRRVRLD